MTVAFSDLFLKVSCIKIDATVLLYEFEELCTVDRPVLHGFPLLDDLEAVCTVHVKEGEHTVSRLPGHLDILVPDGDEDRQRVDLLTHPPRHRHVTGLGEL